MHQFDSDQLEAAGQRLEADAAANTTTNAGRAPLVHRIAADIKALSATARNSHPAGWCEVDGRLRQAMLEIAGTPGAAQLLIAERHHTAFLAMVAEGQAAEQEAAARRFRAAYEAQQAPAREARRTDTAARTATPVLEGLKVFRDRAAEIERSIYARAVGDEDGLIQALDDLGEAVKSLANSAALCRRESRIRRSAAEAEAAVAASLAA